MHYYFIELLDHTDLTEEEFTKCYKDVHALATFPFPMRTHTPQADAEDMTDAPQAAQPQENDGQQEAIKLRDDSLPSKALLLGTFSRPGKAYFDRMEAIEIDISLKKLHTTNTLEESTDATKNRLDAETSVDTELLDDIIRQKVESKTKKLNSELGQLKRQVSQLSNLKGASQRQPSTNSKNSRRGQSTTQGASIIKKKSKPRPAKSTKSPARQAADPAKGTSRRPKGTKGKKQKGRKKNHN